MNQKTRKAQKFCALKMSIICQQNVSEELLLQEFSLSIIQFDNIAFTHSSVKELSHIRSANKVTGKDVWNFTEGSNLFCWRFDYVMRAAI